MPRAKNRAPSPSELTPPTPLRGSWDSPARWTAALMIALASLAFSFGTATATAETTLTEEGRGIRTNQKQFVISENPERKADESKRESGRVLNTRGRSLRASPNLNISDSECNPCQSNAIGGVIVDARRGGGGDTPALRVGCERRGEPASISIARSRESGRRIQHCGATRRRLTGVVRGI